LPVIGCNIGSVSEVINDNEDGYLVEFDDVNMISKKIDMLLKDKKLRTQMGESGYNKVMKRYTWKKVFKEYEKYFNN
jgi:glycosyltransferase involved in cell wall biosynthesis